MSSIAAQCGYAHQSYFGRKFKQATGVSPLRYRAEHAPYPPHQKSAK
jgi:AraC-like DNA-binding protein